MGLFDAPTAMMLRTVGELWTANYDGSSVSFYGTFDAENILQDDASGQPIVVTGSVLVCLSSIASNFTPETQVVVDPNGVQWRVREVLKVDDGILSRCTLVEV